MAHTSILIFLVKGIDALAMEAASREQARGYSAQRGLRSRQRPI
jgi:hypothetical protein